MGVKNNLVRHISFHHQEMSFFKMSICAIGSKLPWRLPMYGRDGHQPCSRGLYTRYKYSLLKLG